MKNIVGMTAVMAMSSGVALASDFRAEYGGFQSGGFYRVSVAGFVDNTRAGYLGINYEAGSPRPGVGQFKNASFKSFCIDLQNNLPGMRDWHIVDIADAPSPGTPYGADRSNAVQAIVAAAIRLNWIQGDLTGANDVRAAALQAGIWAALVDGNISLADVSSNSQVVEDAWEELFDEYSLNTNARVANLRAMVTEGSQDMLYVVPLPPAALAGIATLCGLAGVSRLRRR